MGSCRFPALGVLLSCALVSATVAGPLDPPAGPIAPTAKPLAEVEPRTVVNAVNTPGDADSLFKITQPGSYYLAGNVTGVTGKSGIEIAASGVTLDLNGFAVIGVAGSTIGIESDVGMDMITVRNGSVSGWGQSGIDLNFSDGTLIESIISQNNGLFGVRSGSFSVVRFCAAVGNSSTGIIGFNSSLVESCQATLNGNNGVSGGSGSQISRCDARQNTGNGISVTSDGTVSDCTSFGNALAGINAGSGSRVIDCTAAGNDGGGITASVGCVVVNSVGRSNGGAGISAGTGSSVLACSVTSNTLDGISVSSGCLVMNNTCRSNGSGAGDGAGIRVTGNDNRVEGNSCSGGDRGIDVDSAGNIIVRNTCSGNTTDWDIVADNIYGPIIDRRIPSPVAGTPAVTGTAAVSTLGTTDANANFTY